MKKLMSFALAALMCISLAACGSDAPDSQPAEKDTVITENATSREETISPEDVNSTESVDESADFPAPQVQDIQKFLELDTPYDVSMGTFGSMDFLYTLEHGEEVLMRQFMDILIENYALSLVDVYTYDYESATFKDYRFMYSGKGEEKLERENMDWDVSVGITVHKDKPEVTAGVCYVNGYELADDGYRADYSKVVKPVSTSQNSDNNDYPPPKIQDIRNFLAQDTPYSVDMGTFGSMDFMYSLKHGEEELIQQFIDTLVIGGYGLNLVDVNTYDYESASYKSYDFMYRGKGEKNLQRENMNWDVSIGITTHKDHNEVIAGIFYVNGFELVDDGHRADYSKVAKPASTPRPAEKPSQNPAYQTATADKNSSFIPDFSAFLNRSPSEDKDRYYGGTRKYYQKISLETQQTVVAEVLALLDNDRYQLELIEKVNTDNRIDYNYKYTGNVGMDMIHSKNDDSRHYNLQFTVYNKNNDNGTYGIHFHYSPQFVEENVGYTISANTGGNGGGGGTTPDYERNELPDHSKLQCITCRGSGDCKECGGSIYVYVGGTRTKCNSCKGSGNCRTCGGSGTR